MVRTAAHNAAIRSGTRAAILRAALTCFSSGGFAGTSVRQIAAEAGVATGLLYRHFASKEAVLAAIFAESLAQVRQSFVVAERAADPDARIEALVRGSLAHVRHNLDFWRLSYGVRMQPGVVRSMAAPLAEGVGLIVATLTRYFRQRGDARPDVEARVLFGLIDGVCQHFALDPRGYPLDEVADAIVARYRSASRATKTGSAEKAPARVRASDLAPARSRAPSPSPPRRRR